MGGLNARVARHLRPRKKMRWHIDFLLAGATVREIFVWESKKRWSAQSRKR